MVPIISGGAFGGIKTIRVMLVLDMLAGFESFIFDSRRRFAEDFLVVIGKGLKFWHVAGSPRLSPLGATKSV